MTDVATITFVRPLAMKLISLLIDTLCKSRSMGLVPKLDVKEMISVVRIDVADGISGISR